MGQVRISAQQKNVMLMIHFIELKHGTNTPVHSSYLRQKVEGSLSREIASNHFLVSLNKLVENGYMTVMANNGKRLNQQARENENMWRLTELGRQYAETLHSARLSPKRAYHKKKATAA